MLQLCSATATDHSAAYEMYEEETFPSGFVFFFDSVRRRDDTTEWHNDDLFSVGIFDSQ